MSVAPWILDYEDLPEVVHVYPVFGKAHVLDGYPCWCEPTADTEEPRNRG